jgi:glycerophosphoryl diester phosphodiesterase
MQRRTRIISWAQRVGPRKSAPPKNSIPMVKLAIEADFDGIELDVRIANDGVPVLAHDNEISGPDGSITVSTSTSEELTAFRLNVHEGKDVFVPTLREALGLINDKLVMVDHRGKPEEAEILRRAIESAGFAPHRLMFCIYDAKRARAFIDAFPEGTMLFKKPHHSEVSDEFLDEVKNLGLHGIMLNRPIIGKNYAPLMSRLRSRNLQVLFYVHGDWSKQVTPEDSLESLHNMLDAGVDYITSTESHLVSQVVNR